MSSVANRLRVIQERNGSNTPAVSYTRGSDLSGTLEGAGGIGGLLARSHGYSSGNWSTHNYYHADGNGNITYLVNASQALAASYRYDAYGNILSSSGSQASANTYRFSSKMVDALTGLYYYGYRWYAPNLQRWLNRDPLGDLGSPIYTGDFTAYSMIREPVEVWQSANLFSFVANWPTDVIDPWGLQGQLCTDKSCENKKCPVQNLPGEGWEKKHEKGDNPWEKIPEPGKCADSDGLASPSGVIKIPDNCTCYLTCSNGGVDLSCKCEGFFPRPRKPTKRDGYPPNPYETNTN